MVMSGGLREAAAGEAACGSATRLAAEQLSMTYNESAMPSDHAAGVWP